jgi:RNA polymerase sigma factor FliA
MKGRNTLESCAETYRNHPDQKSRDAVVYAAEPLIRSIMSSIKVPTNAVESDDELYNAGVIAALQALDSYDADRGASFATHAYGRIYGEMIDYLRRIDPLPRRRRAKVAMVNRNRDVLSQELTAAPADEHVAERSQMTLVEYHRVLNDAGRRSDASLFQSCNSEDGMRLLDVVADESGMDTLEDMESGQLREHLTECMDMLDPRERTILSLYFDGEMTLAGIGAVIGVSEARVSQLRKKALVTLERVVDPELRWAA